MLNPSYQLPDLTSLDGLETIEVFKALEPVSISRLNVGLSVEIHR
jgi:hypothetical protein